MRKSIIGGFLTVVLIALFGSLNMPGLLYADDKYEFGTENDEALSFADQDSTQPSLDSIFNEINICFKRLEPIFRRGCYDCHTSDKTMYPWYHKIPGIKQLIDHDLKEGLENLDMTNGFPFVGKTDISFQSHKLEEIKEVLEKGEMPIFIYRMMHWDAAPDNEEKDSIYLWIDHTLDLLK